MARDLESLQDRLPPFSQAEAEAVIVAALERPLAQVFYASFGPAVAAASIAQVHRAEIERERRAHAGCGEGAAAQRRARVSAVDLDDFYLRRAAMPRHFRPKRAGCG